MNFPEPPSGVTGELREYLQRVAQSLRAQPTWSFASLANPNSAVTGKVGDWFINIGSASTLSRVWTKAGPDGGTYSQVSWVVLRVLP